MKVMNSAASNESAAGRCQISAGKEGRMRSSIARQIMPLCTFGKKKKHKDVVVSLVRLGRCRYKNQMCGTYLDRYKGDIEPGTTR